MPSFNEALEASGNYDGGFGRTVGGRRMAAAGDQSPSQDKAQRSGMLAGAGDTMLFHVIPL